MQIFLSPKTIFRQNLKMIAFWRIIILSLEIESKILFLQTHGKTHRKKKNHPKNPQKPQETLAFAKRDSVFYFSSGFAWNGILFKGKNSVLLCDVFQQV